MNYRCWDYNCNGSMKFLIIDINMNPKILKDHSKNCKEIKKVKP